MNTHTKPDETAVPIEILHLIGRVYDAALTPELWTDVLKEIAVYFNSIHAMIFDENFTLMTAQTFLGSSSIGDAMSNYNRQVIFHNPLRVPILMTKGIGDIFNPTDVVAPDEYVQTRYFRDHIARNKWGDGLLIMLDKTATKADFFIVTRGEHQLYFSDAERAHLRLLAPHIQKAFMINRALAEGAKKVADLREAVDEVPTAIFFIDDKSRIAHMNNAARRIITRNDVFQVELDQLRAIGTENQILFADALATSTSKGEFLLRSQANQDYIIRILPLAAQSASPVVTGAASAMVFAKRAELAPSSSIELIAQRYRLTPREMSVLVGIVEIGGVPGTAATLGLKQGTVRGHLKSIFAKTESRSQMDLAKLVSSYS